MAPAISPDQTNKWLIRLIELKPSDLNSNWMASVDENHIAAAHMAIVNSFEK